jgi:hypothetical protein
VTQARRFTCFPLVQAGGSIEANFFAANPRVGSFPLVQAGGSIEANVITESSSLTWVFRWFKLAAIPNSTIPLWRKVSRIFR